MFIALTERSQAMPRVFAIVVGLLSLLAFTGIAAADEFIARLRGDNEVPPVVTNTTGRALIKFNPLETAAEFVLSVNDGVRLTQAHIHCGPAGVNGPVVVFLAGLISQGLDVDGRWISNATFTAANIINTSCGSTLAELAQSMRDGNMYANAHSVANPGGEVRGQLRLK
jgi:hypothetical protein